MNLIWFLTISLFLTLIPGEFGRFPFGGGGGISFTLLDILLGVTLTTLIVWQIGINKDLKSLLVLKALAPFYLFAFVSLLIAGNFDGVLYLLRFIFYSSSFWLGYSLLKSKIIKLQNIENLILLIGLTLSLVGFIQLVIFPDLIPFTIYGFDPHQGRLVSSFLDPNFLGIFLNIILAIIFFSWGRKPRRELVLFGVICFLAIIFTFSRSSYLFLLTTLVSGGLLKKKLILIPLLIFIIGLFITIPRFQERILGAFKIDKSSSERFISWNNGLKLFKMNPLSGVGFNNTRGELLSNALAKTYTEDGGHAGAGIDSSILFVMATTGIIGLIFYLLSWFLMLQGSSNLIIILPMLFGLFISSQFVNALFYPPIMLLTYFWLGCLKGERLD